MLVRNTAASHSLLNDSLWNSLAEPSGHKKCWWSDAVNRSVGRCSSFIVSHFQPEYPTWAHYTVYAHGPRLVWCLCTDLRLKRGTKGFSILSQPQIKGPPLLDLTNEILKALLSTFNGGHEWCTSNFKRQQLQLWTRIAPEDVAFF